MKNDDEILELCEAWFEEIAERCDRLTSGNVSHSSKAMRGFALNCAEFITEHLKSKIIK